MLPKSFFFFFQKPIFLFDFKQLHKSNRGLIFDPSFSNAGWKIAFHARKGRRKQPADTQHTEHARCQPLLLNLMPLSLPPPLSLISLSARNECWWQGCQQRFVSSSAGEHYLPVCLCYTNAPQSCSPFCAQVSWLYCQSLRPTVTCLITLHCFSMHIFACPAGWRLKQNSPHVSKHRSCDPVFSLGRLRLPTWRVCWPGSGSLSKRSH